MRRIGENGVYRDPLQRVWTIAGTLINHGPGLCPVSGADRTRTCSEEGMLGSFLRRCRWEASLEL